MIYRLHVYRRNPRDEYYFHQQSNDRIKANEDLDFYCGGSEKSRSQWLHKELFLNFLELHVRGRILFLL